jgi:hypothetical protein
MQGLNSKVVDPLYNYSRTKLRQRRGKQAWQTGVIDELAPPLHPTSIFPLLPSVKSELIRASVVHRISRAMTRIIDHSCVQRISRTQPRKPVAHKFWCENAA